jgi:hypothetical protein
MLVSALASVAAAAFAPPAFAPTEASSTRIASSGQPLLSHLSRTLTPLHRERCLSRCVRMEVIERELTEAEREAKRVAALARLARIRLLNNIALVNAVVIGFVAFSVGYEILCHQAALERAPRLLSTTGVRVPLVTEGRISGPSPRSTILTLDPISTRASNERRSRPICSHDCRWILSTITRHLCRSTRSTTRRARRASRTRWATSSRRSSKGVT